MHNRKRSFYRSFVDMQQPKPLQSLSKPRAPRIDRIIALSADKPVKNTT